MTNRELINLTYDNYSADLQNKVSTLSSRYDKVKIAREFYSTQCLDNQMYVAKNNTNYQSICNSIREGTINYNKLNKANNTLRFNSHNAKINTINDAIVDSTMIMIYFKNLIRNYILEYKLEYKIDHYNSIMIDKELFSTIYKKLYFNVSRFILRGGSFVVGNWYRLYMARKKANFNKDKTNVDWGKSIKFLCELAERYNEDLYFDFKGKDITKDEFIVKMKPYVYSKETPDKPKWLVYNTNDWSSWLLVSTYYSKCPNKSNYGITPTHYINLPNQSIIEFGSKCTNMNQILDTTDLGFRDKIHCMERFDMNFCKMNWTNYNILNR